MRQAIVTRPQVEEAREELACTCAVYSEYRDADGAVQDRITWTECRCLGKYMTLYGVGHQLREGAAIYLVLTSRYRYQLVKRNTIFLRQQVYYRA